MYNNYISQRVFVKPNVIGEGDTVTVTYNGILAQCGADQVYAHIGFGDTKTWHNPTYTKMSRTNEGFETTIPINTLSNLHIAFKDSANNWDNNSGSNYSFNVQSR